MDELEESVDVEAIMREIREQIVAQKARETGDPDPIPVAGRHLPPDFYEHLYQLQMSADRLALQPEIAPSTVPLVGPLLDRLRRPWHQLVIFYVNRLAGQQMTLNRHLLRTVDLLAREVERLADGEEREKS
jgi:hypothetical protein